MFKRSLLVSVLVVAGAVQTAQAFDFSPGRWMNPTRWFDNDYDDRYGRGGYYPPPGYGAPGYGYPPVGPLPYGYPQPVAPGYPYAAPGYAPPAAPPAPAPQSAPASTYAPMPAANTTPTPSMPVQPAPMLAPSSGWNSPAVSDERLVFPPPDPSEATTAAPSSIVATPPAPSASFGTGVAPAAAATPPNLAPSTEGGSTSQYTFPPVEPQPAGN